MKVVLPRGSGKAGKRVSLDEHEIHHLKVRRAKDGEPVQVLDGAGLVGTGTLVQMGREWMVEVGSAELQPPPAPLTLAVAMGDRDRFSWMVEKSVELGVTRVVPLQSERTAGVVTRLKDVHLDRLRRSALDAIKQCGAAWVPAIDTPRTLSAFAGEPLGGTAWLADECGAPAPAALDDGAVTVIIGPEGGLTSTERDTAVAAGYQLVSLGLHTLRFETAAVAAAAAVTHARMRSAHG
ncbi:MAG TPA: RsmE family RNA methyltransferase [Gemmatimonadales bacterium]|nr:RsmE family RNA methyltransferase [Gemmatimonadales bacterium]